MAWTTPRTWVAAAILTAAQLNTDIRDNENFLFNPPQCRAFNNANISITNNLDTILGLNSERWDSGTPSNNMHDNTTNNSRIICRVAGLYLISGHISWAANATGKRYLQLRLNGATGIAETYERPTVSEVATMSVSTTYQLAVNDYVEMRCYQDSGAALNVSVVGNLSPELSVIRVG